MFLLHLEYDFVRHVLACSGDHSACVYWITVCLYIGCLCVCVCVWNRFRKECRTGVIRSRFIFAIVIESKACRPLCCWASELSHKDTHMPNITHSSLNGNQATSDHRTACRIPMNTTRSYISAKLTVRMYNHNVLVFSAQDVQPSSKYVVKQCND